MAFIARVSSSSSMVTQLSLSTAVFTADTFSSWTAVLGRPSRTSSRTNIWEHENRENHLATVEKAGALLSSPFFNLRKDSRAFKPCRKSCEILLDSCSSVIWIKFMGTVWFLFLSGVSTLAWERKKLVLGLKWMLNTIHKVASRCDDCYWSTKRTFGRTLV